METKLIINLSNSLANNPLFSGNNPYSYINTEYGGLLKLIDIYSWVLVEFEEDDIVETNSLLIEVEITENTFEKLATLISQRVYYMSLLDNNINTIKYSFEAILNRLKTNTEDNISDLFMMFLSLERLH